MRTGLAMAYLLALVLSVGVYAASAQLNGPGKFSLASSVGPRLPLNWAPDWVARPLGRAIADASDPRERSKATGAPVD